MPHLTALVLAAGRSSRMGAANKLLLPLGDRSLLARTAETVCAAPVQDVVVVTGHDHAQVSAVTAPYRARLVHNPDYAEGLSSSIRRGILAAAPETDGYMICLGDMPLVAAATLTHLCDAFAARAEPSIVVPAMHGRHGHPVVFHCAFRPDLLRLEGDRGARPVLEAHPEAVVRVDVDDPGIFEDVDTEDAYRRLRGA